MCVSACLTDTRRICTPCPSPAPGLWKPQHGYWLSSISLNASDPNVFTYYQAAATVNVTMDGSGDKAPVKATLTLSDPVCTGGCPDHSTLHVTPCKVDYTINCLVDTDPSVWAWTLDESNKPQCVTQASDWSCKARLTGSAYQDSGHAAAFYTRMIYMPDVPGPPLHVMPFGTFETGCPPTNTATLQGRLIQSE